MQKQRTFGASRVNQNDASAGSESLRGVGRVDLVLSMRERCSKRTRGQSETLHNRTRSLRTTSVVDFSLTERPQCKCEVRPSPATWRTDIQYLMSQS